MKNIEEISSLPVKGKNTLYYYPKLNLLTFKKRTSAFLKESREFNSTLWLLYLGFRKLKALSESRMPPKTLLVEPWRTCNLSCTYCYAHVKSEFSGKLDLSFLSNIIKKYNFSSILIFGGEPLIDKEFINSILKFEPEIPVSISTNGILMDKKFISDIVNYPNVNVHVSLEPQEWGARVDKAGHRQLDILHKKIEGFELPKFSFRVVIPAKSSYLPITEFIDRLAQEIGSYNFSLSYWPENGTKLPDWISRWIKESFDALTKPDAEKYNGKLLADSLMNYFLDVSENGFRFSNCDATHGSVSIGPDNKLHVCHENAVVEREYDIISSENSPIQIDVNKSTDIAYKWANNQNNAVCEACEAKFVCGGICYLNTLHTSACSFLKQLLPLTLTEMLIHKLPETLRLVERSEKNYEQLFEIREELKKEVTNPTWLRLVSGELPVKRALELSINLKGNY